MSDTNPGGIRTLPSTPAPEPLTGLTGAPAAIYTELAHHTDPVTAAELALAAGLGRSTAGKALTTLEKLGLAVRTPGGHDGPRRTPDRWHPAPTREDGGDTGNCQQTVSTRPETSAAHASEPDGNRSEDEDATVDDKTPEASAAPADEDTIITTTQVTDTSLEPKPQGTAQTDGKDNDASTPLLHAGKTTEENSAPVAASTENRAAPTGVITPPGEKKRLAPGALRQMVIEHLAAHPGEAFTATKISRVIEKSSGAIANALEKLVNQGIAEQVSDKPRTFRRTSTTTTE
ncbi:MarR family transcriptional regulator [Streptomyces lycii]|uniref:Helix-turn-helix domain-containing protein n=1 Tax=Streptomyces lycii TaxID=2654337 RepID=A0ABQ7FNY2_9ACTN|nr:MarR family transcriptional regulator [Streptomyces lycii]KAF4408922.1 helix-turn-helix domain-containing protein [Streptomyces lycii]